jgi:uncharacterized damage-inducible protein DinB
MNAVERIIEQLNFTYRGPSWHGPTLMELLQDVTEEEAAQVLLPNTHSIWEIVQHCAAWKRAVIQRLDGEQVSLQGEADWPPVVDPNNRAWRDALAELDAAHGALEARSRQLADDDLDRNAPRQDMTLYRTVHGVMEHDIYHAGQIALLKKAMRGQ